MAQSPITLPAELWQCIAQSLPSHELSSMFTVNSTFFRLAMDERYKDLSLYQLEGDMVNYLMHLRSVFIPFWGALSLIVCF